jgi:hypothetical protein
MADSLAIYLNDHLAGAKFAIESLERLRDAHRDKHLGRVVAKILNEVQQDLAVLQDLCDKAGGNEGLLKEAGAWLAERTARLKLRLSNDVDLGEFELLEVLSLGVLGKLKLWTALGAIAPNDARLGGVDFWTLIERAQTQHDELESLRIAAAKEALVRTAAAADRASDA